MFAYFEEHQDFKGHFNLVQVFRCGLSIHLQNILQICIKQSFKRKIIFLKAGHNEDIISPYPS